MPPPLSASGRLAGSGHMPQPSPSASTSPSASGRLQGALRPAPGELLAERYELREPLGQGAHGVVFRALDRRAGTDVAIKLVGAGRLSARLVREGRLVARLDHPGIVRVLDGGERPGGGAFLVLELVRGARPLEAVVPTLDRAARLRCLLAIADALAAAHAEGVVHRDVKAGNVLVGGDGRPRLTDFGIARVADDDRRDRLTRTGEVVGTPSIMAPEQFQGGALGPPVDVWALGALLYELLTDRPPFTGDHPAQLFTHVCDRPPIAPRAHDGSIPAPLERLCLWALEKRADDRPADAAAFAAALRAALDDRPAPRSPALLVGAGVALGALAAGLVVAVAARAPGPAPVALPPPPPTPTPPTPPTEPTPPPTEPPPTEPPPTEPPPTEPTPTEPPPKASPPTPLERSRALEAEGDVVGAIVVLAEREGAEVPEPEVAERLVRLREQHCLKHHERALADPRLPALEALLQRGDFRAALPRLDALIEDHPASSVLRRARGGARLNTSDPAGGLADLKVLVALAPRLDIGWVDYANALSAAGDEAAALDALDRGSALNGGGGAELCFARGYRWHLRADRTGDRAEFERARAAYDRVLEGTPDHADARLNRAGLRAYVLDDAAGAVADLEALVAHHGQSATVLTAAARVHLSLGRAPDAVALLDRARALAAGDAQALAGIDALLVRARAGH